MTDRKLTTTQPPETGGNPAARNHGDAPDGPEANPRRRWMGILARADINDLESAWDALEHKPNYEFLRGPETGLVMVRGRAGNVGKRFNLGEMAVTRCAVRLEDETVGLSWVMGRSKRKAELTAAFDGLLQNEALRPLLEARVLAPLDERRQLRLAQQRTLAEETTVDFFTLVRGS